MRDFKKLLVWQRSDELSDHLSRLCRTPSFRRTRVLSDQLERAAESIPNLIAEGAGAATRAHYATFLDRAGMSANEVEHLLRKSKRRRLIAEAEADRFVDEVGQIRRMILSLRKRILAEAD